MHRQVFVVGLTCGITIERDEVVEGLSPAALRAVVAADRSGQTGITLAGKESEAL